MDRKLNPVVFFLLLIIIIGGASIIYFKSTQQQQKPKKPHNKTIIKIPYNYTLKLIPVHDNELHVLINVTKKGNTPQKLIVNITCFDTKEYKIRSLLKKEETIKLSSLELFKENDKTFKLSNLRNCKYVNVSICDTFLNICKNYTYLIGPHTYDINVFLIDNYTLQINVTPINFTLHRDRLKITVEMFRPSTTPGRIEKINLFSKSYSSIEAPPITSTEIPKINLTIKWKEIKFIKATISVTIMESSTKQILYHKNFTIQPEVVLNGVQKLIYNGKILIKGVEVIGDFNSDINISYKDPYGRIKWLNKSCVEQGYTLYCFGAYRVHIKNIGDKKVKINVDKSRVICKNNQGDIFYGKYLKLDTGAVGKIRGDYHPNEEQDIYLYCHMTAGTVLKEIYMLIYVNNEPYEIIFRV